MSVAASVIIRKAVKADMPAVLELIKELATFEKEPDAVQLSVADLERDGFGQDRQFSCFVAQIETVIVGMALVYYRYSTWKGRTLHLEDLVVSQPHRGKGVGSALFNQVMQYAADKGVKRVNWVVLDWNKEAIEFYKKAGATIMPHWWQVEMDKEALEKYLISPDEGI